jgi:NodT family efflux transporter outer membrane factor (OMF) lipoprotein
MKQRPVPYLTAGLLAGLLSLGACSLAPDYQPPDLDMPQTYQENGDWAQAEPAADTQQGAWWLVFNDPQLNALEDEVTASNQSLKIALAQYQEAHAAASAARAAYFPLVTGTAGGLRQQTSTHVADPRSHQTFNDYLLQADLTYEIDLWGRVRNLVAANEDQAQASAADLAAVDLSLHAELAADYFTLRGDDAQQAILDETVSAYKEAFELTRQRYQGGVAAEADADQAETQYESTKTQAEDLRMKRAQLAHAIAVLTGHAPSSLALPAAPLAAMQAPIPAPGLPSTLLQRRPDIVAAERRTAAANAEIGVARAAWFPAIDLGASVGAESAALSNLITAPSLFWSLGPSATATLFDGGRIDALTDEARAAFDEAAANYRQTVLAAFQDVEDNLAAVRQLDLEGQSQKNASAAADRALARTQDRYKGGIATYLDVVVTQNTALQTRLSLVDIQTRRLIASVQLIKALGGGWQAPAGDSGVVTQFGIVTPAKAGVPFGFL